MKLKGKVIKKKWAEGSKSEHEAVCIETETQTFKLRRFGGNPFNDPELEELVGQEIEAEGKTGDANIFFATNLEIIMR